MHNRWQTEDDFREQITFARERLLRSRARLDALKGSSLPVSQLDIERATAYHTACREALQSAVKRLGDFVRKG